MRYEHFLSSSKGDSYPDAVIGLGVELAPSLMSPKRKVIEYYARRICYCVYERENNAWRNTDNRESYSLGAFWRLLYRSIRRFRQVTLACFNACEVWGAIGIFEQIEDGTITLTRDPIYEKQNDDILPDVPQIPKLDSRMGKGRTRESELHELRPDQNRVSPKHKPRRNRSVALGKGSYIVLENPPSIAECYHAKSGIKLTFLDVRNYGIDSLPEGIQANQVPSYCTDQITSLITTLIDNNWGSFKHTAGSQAMHTFRHAFLKDSILCHNVTSALELEAESYVGGRCEAFRIGPYDYECYGVDTVSMYPSCFATNQVPIRLSGQGRMGNGSSEYENTNWSNRIACVCLETQTADYPKKLEGKVIYPVGRFKTTLCGPELVHAFQAGRVLRVYNWSSYECSNALAEFGRILYETRAEAISHGSIAQSDACKRILNSLAGKFCQKDRRWVDVPTRSCEKPWSYWYEVDNKGELNRWRSLAWNVQREVLGTFSHDAVPAISSWITSLARMKLLSFMEKAERSEVLYIDTDALIVTAKGYRNLIASGCLARNTLGLLQLREQSTSCEIMGIKHYRIGNTYKESGYPHAFRDQETNSRTGLQSVSIAEQIRAGTRPRVIQHNVLSRRQSAYTHGYVQSDGIVSPIVLREEP